MAKYALLNNIQHKDLRVITQFSATYGDNITSTLTFPTEFADIQKEYPIFFKLIQIQKNTNRLYCLALAKMKICF